MTSGKIQLTKHDAFITVLIQHSTSPRASLQPAHSLLSPACDAALVCSASPFSLTLLACWRQAAGCGVSDPRPQLDIKLGCCSASPTLPATQLLSICCPARSLPRASLVSGSVLAKMASTSHNAQPTHPYTCNACSSAFRSSELQRAHMQSDWQCVPALLLTRV